MLTPFSFQAILQTYGVQKYEVRAFFHYPPTFHHVHVHFTRLGNEFGCPVEKAHMVTDVIESLKFNSDSYAQRTFTCRIPENDKFYLEYANSTVNA